MAMMSVTCCSALSGSVFYSSLWPAGGSNGALPIASSPASPLVASLQLRPQQQFSKSQPLRRRATVRQLARRVTTNRGAAFASLRDAQELVQSGVVRPVLPAEVSGLLSEGAYVLLDIRPVWERQKAFVPGSYHVPFFVEDTSSGALTLLKKGIQQGQGGWWMGQKLTTRNEQFVEQVQAAVPSGQKLLVTCGEGLRSLLALEELNDAGFEELAWLAGGFNSVRDSDFPSVEGSTKLRFATVGGASQYVLKFAVFLSGVGRGRESPDSS